MRPQIACASDAGYLPHAAAMLHSVLTNGKISDADVHLLHGSDLTAENRASLEGMVRGLGAGITLLELEADRVCGLRTVGHMLPSALWYRIYLPELLPEADKVLYLDCDLIAVDSLQPLWDTDLSDHYLGAVTNVFMREHVGRVRELGLGDHLNYFNSGVLLLNLEKMREDGATAALRRYALENFERIDFPDQDTLNAVLGKNRLHLHPRWNVMNSIGCFPWAGEVFGERELQEARQKPGIRHFEGPAWNKPWHYLCPYSTRELYFRHRRKTPWPNVALEGRTAANRVRKLLGRGPKAEF